MSLWNKVLHTCSRRDGAGSRAFVRYVRFGSSGSIFLESGWPCTGVLVCLSVLCSLLAAATTVVKGQGVVAVCVVMWCEGLDYCSVFQRRAMVMGQVSVGCIPGRRATTGCFIMSLWTGVSCGSFQSHGEMAFFLAWMGSRPSSFSDGEFSGGARWWAESMASTKDFMAFNVILFSSRVFCARWLGQLSLLYPSSACLYLYQFVLVFLTV